MLSLVVVLLAQAHAASDVSGTVFEDPDGDGSLADALDVPGATVVLWQDGGDGLPDGVDDLELATTVTGAVGDWRFAALADGTYWVTVDSRTVEPVSLDNGMAVTDTWAEQTWAPVGGYCVDGAGVALILADSGPCYGGRNGNRGDGTGTLATREHLARVDVAGAAVADVDFGFSFHVFTRITDASEDAVRFAQGTWRQAVRNANAVDGFGTTRFVPAVPTNASGGGGSWWSITLTSSLQDLENEGTNIDGTAWCNGWVCPLATKRDPNPGTVGGGVFVGTGPDGVPDTGDEVWLAPFERPELELQSGDAFELDIEGLYSRVAYIAFYRTQLDNRGDWGVYEHNLFGMRADGSIPLESNRPGMDPTAISTTPSSATTTRASTTTAASSPTAGRTRTSSS